MKQPPARIPRRILAGMPAVWAALYLGHAAGCGALFLWLMLSLCQREPHYPYPRKSRPYASRLFFAFSGGTFVLLRFSGQLSFPAAYPGIAAFSVMIASLLWQWKLPKRRRLMFSLILLFIACM